jgi:hypothetical protein
MQLHSIKIEIPKNNFLDLIHNMKVTMKRRGFHENELIGLPLELIENLNIIGIEIDYQDEE